MDETSAVTGVNEVVDEVERAYHRQSERLWRALLLFGDDAEVASDAVAEAFAQALRRGAAIRDVDRWVWRAAFRIARGELKRRLAGASEVPDIPAETPVDTVDVIRALKELSPKQRGSIVLHHYAGYSTKETAAILGSTAAAVGVHLERGRKRLRDLLGDDDA